MFQRVGAKLFPCQMHASMHKRPPPPPPPDKPMPALDSRTHAAAAMLANARPGFNAPALSLRCRYFNGSRTGLLRDPINVQTEPWAIRYPYQNLAAIPSRAIMALGWEMPYNKRDWLRCTDPTLVKVWTGR
eukprot:355982-Chlamydomonas_euryale.AAC.1